MNKPTITLLLAAVVAGCACAAAPTLTDPLAAGFVNPPDSAKPSAFWWWFYSLVSNEGITRDLEEFKAKGLGGVLLVVSANGYGVGPMPKGPAFLSNEWRELYKHALHEANRLGLEVGVNLCGGWDMGGPWIQPTEAERWFVQSSITLTGPRKFSGVLPRPGAADGLPTYRDWEVYPIVPDEHSDYRDSATVAFREPEEAGIKHPIARASSNREAYPERNVTDGNELTFWTSGNAPSREHPEWLQFDYVKRVKSDGLWLMPRTPYGPREIEIQVSDNGRDFHSIKTATLPQELPIEVNRVAAQITFPEISARFFRILIRTSWSVHNVQICEASFTGPPLGDRMRSLPVKSARAHSNCFLPARKLMDLVTRPWQPAAADSPIPASGILDLTGKVGPDGHFEWDVPEGTWTILRTGHTITGRRVALGLPESDGLEVDWLSRTGVEKQFRSLGEILLADAGPLVGKTLKYFDSDSFEDGLPNWTERFLDKFREYRGYDAKPYLPVLAGRIVGSAEISDRFLHDYRKTVADCMADEHYKHFAELAHARGLVIQNEAGGPSWPGTYPMDALKNLGRTDRPMGEFWMGSTFIENGQNKVGKQTASAAHLYGRAWASAEAFTGGGHWKDTPATLKPVADRAFAEGINRFVFHTMTASRPEDGRPGYEYGAGTHLNPNITWWAQAGAWLAYINRCQYLLQQGLFVGDVLYYNGDWAPNLVEPKHVDPSLGRGYDYDVANAEVLLTRAAVQDGRIVLPDGMSYRLLVLPNSRRMPVEVLRKIRDLIAAGATVVGPKPEKDPGLRDYPQCDQEVRRLAAEVWGDCDGHRVTEHKYGKGTVFLGQTPREILAGRGVEPDFQYSTKDAFIDFIHRSTGDAEIYFVANRNDRQEVLDCTFRVSGKQPELWDPVTGEIRIARAFKQSGGRTSLPLEFAPYGSLFIVFRTPIPATLYGVASKNSPTLSTKMPITGPWTVRFDPKWGGPETAEFKVLESWTARPEEGIKYYSGTGTYIKTFRYSADSLKPGQRVLLDLGEVKDIAEVRLNGRQLGVAWTKPFRVDMTNALKTGENKLQIAVTNQWPNRLIGDGKLPPGKRFTNTNVLDYYQPKRGGHQLLRSGLLGPVTITIASPDSQTELSGRSAGVRRQVQEPPLGAMLSNATCKSTRIYSDSCNLLRR